MTQKDVVDKVSALVQRKWKGDYAAAFAAEDTDGDGRISVAELESILVEAGVAYFKIGAWPVAKAIMAVFDGNADGFIEWSEFEAVFKAHHPS